ARGFVWSSAVENDVPIARDLLVPRLQLRGRHKECAGQFDAASGLDVHWAAQVNDQDFLARFDLAQQIVRVDAGDAQLAEEALTLPDLPYHLARQQRPH